MDADRMIDLADLERGFASLQALGDRVMGAAGQGGAPLELALADIAEDPEQPRRAFDMASLQELADSIAVDRVRTPISVKPLNAAGKYIINHGARRYRASLLAGRTTFPAFIDDSHDDYAQVVENLQRDALTPLEIARFIGKRRAAGDRDTDIAKRLGKDKSTIAQYAALLGWPASVEALYEAGLCRDVSTLYGLIKLHRRAPAAVDGLCQHKQPVTRRDLAALEKRLAGEKGARLAEPQLPSAPDPVGTPPAAVASNATAPVRAVEATWINPVLQVRVDGIAAVLLLQRCAPAGYGWIREVVSTAERQIPLARVCLENIVDAEEAGGHLLSRDNI
jgi:ParB family chromosome partitioning protein